ncbi:MAG: ATP-binding protein [Candidatus Neomarinimicrobiota bacterium]
MNDQRKTKSQLIAELEQTRHRLAELERIKIEHRQKAKALQESFSKYKAVAEAIPNMIFRLDKEGTFLEYVPAKGLDPYAPPAEFIGKNIRNVLPEEMASQSIKILQETLSTREAHVFEYPLKIGDETRYYEARHVIYGEDEILGIVRDITERKQSEETLRVTDWELSIRNEIANIFLTTADDMMYGEVLECVLKALESKYGVFGYIDSDGAIVYPSMTRDIWDQCQIPDKSIVFPRESWGGIWGRALTEKRTLYSNKPFKVPEGHIAIDRAIDVPIIHKGDVIGNLMVGNKATDYDDKDVEMLETIANYIAPVLSARLQRDRHEEERKRAEAEREASIAELEAKNTELERFTYTISHDLRSPLVTIKGFLDFLEEDAAKGNIEEVKEDIMHIATAADKMNSLLTELLELSRIGRFIGFPEEFSFGELAQEVVKLLAGLIVKRGVQTEIAPDLPVIYADRTRIFQVLKNLVENAVMFMGDQPQPVVEIGCRKEAEGQVFFVRDNGIGIDPSNHERVFDLFYKLDTKSEGTGLGLYLAKRIVEVHGGHIWVESEGLGRGSTFCFTIPSPPATTNRWGEKSQD